MGCNNDYNAEIFEVHNFKISITLISTCDFTVI